MRYKHPIYMHRDLAILNQIIISYKESITDRYLSCISFIVPPHWADLESQWTMLYSRPRPRFQHSNKHNYKIICTQ